jgi:hypothetical protein
MASQSFPTAFIAEVRGIRPGGEFTANDTGELVKYAPQLKVDRAMPDGDCEFYALRVTPAVTELSDVVLGQLERGDEVEVHGDAVVGDGQSRSYFVLRALRSAAVPAAA